MITPETVKLADRLPELERKLVEERVKHAKARADEEKRHNAELERLTNEESKVLADHARAARAKAALMNLVSSDLCKARDKAGSDYREAAQRIEHERRERDGARGHLEERRLAGVSKAELDGLEEQLEGAEDLYRDAKKKLDELKKSQGHAEAAVEAAYQSIRREVLAKKAERADRG